MADIFDLFKQIAKKDEAPKQPISWLIVGLGNPGEKYKLTRHNAGFLTIDYLAEQDGVRIDRAKYHALCAEATVAGSRVLLLKPQTLMNASGLAVQEAAAFYKIPLDHILVISDDIVQRWFGHSMKSKTKRHPFGCPFVLEEPINSDACAEGTLLAKGW